MTDPLPRALSTDEALRVKALRDQFASLAAVVARMLPESDLKEVALAAIAGAGEVASRALILSMVTR